MYSHTLTQKAAYDKKTITDNDLNTAIGRFFTYIYTNTSTMIYYANQYSHMVLLFRVGCGLGYLIHQRIKYTATFQQIKSTLKFWPCKLHAQESIVLL